MKTLFVSFYPKSLSPRQSTHGTSFYPGANRLNREEWQSASKHPITQIQIESGEMKVIEPIAKKEGDCLTDYSESDGIQIVQGTYEIAVLIEWLEDEKRSPVVDALKTQIRLLEAIGCPPRFSTDNGHMSRLAWLDHIRPAIIYKHFPEFSPTWKRINSTLTTAAI